MRRGAILWLMAVLACGPAMAQENQNDGLNTRDDKVEVGSYAPDVEAEVWINSDGDLPREKVPTLTELRGMVVVLYFWVSFHDGGEAALPELNQIDANTSLRTGVQIIGLSSGDRAAIEPQIKRNKVRFPVGLSSKTADDYKITRFPSIVIIDPNGRITQIADVSQAGSFSQTLFDTLNNVPPSRTHPEEAEKAVAKIDEARRLMRERDYQGAFQAARDASERATLGDPLKNEAYSFVDLIERIGYDQLALVDPLLDNKKYSEAAVILRTVAKQFRNLAPGRDAKRRTKELEENNDSFKAAVGDLASEKAAAELLHGGIADIRARRFGDGYTKLNKILTEYAKTEAAEYAKPIIDRLKANSDAWGLVSDDMSASDSQQWLAQGRAMKASRRYSEAKEYFSRVLTTYPGTTWAEQARQELVNLPSP